MKDNPDKIHWNTSFPIDNKRKRTSFEQYLSSKILATATENNNNSHNNNNNSTNLTIDQEDNNLESVETKYRKIKNVLSMVSK